MTTTTTTTTTPRPREIDELPSPRGVPVIGNLLQIRPESMHRTLEQWARELGPVYRFRVGRSRAVVIGDHEAFGAALRDRPEGFRRPPQSAELVREMGFQVGVFSANGESWKRQRRLVMAGFDPRHLKAYFPSLVKVARRLDGRWRQAARENRAIDLQADLMRFTVDAIAGLAFGADVNTLESEADVIQRHIDQIFPILWKRLLSPVPVWRYLKREADRRLDESVVEVKRAIDQFIAQARERLAADPLRREHPVNLLEAMIVAADQADSGVTDDDVRGNVLTLLLAGEDTTANTLAWTLDLLWRHPATLQRAVEQARRLVPSPDSLSLEVLGELDYLEACAHEAMRLKPVAPMLALDCLRETVVAGVRIVPGTRMFGILRHDGTDARYFEDPEAFRPERWLVDGGPGQMAASSKRVSMPFGAGPRVCPGRHLALLEMKLALATLLSGFDITELDCGQPGATPECLAFTMAPVGLKMRLREHNL